MIVASTRAGARALTSGRVVRRARSYHLPNLSSKTSPDRCARFSSDCTSGVRARTRPLCSRSRTAMADRHVERFPLSASCSLLIQKGDITRWSVDGSSDAIVNAANEKMLGGGGVDGAIHRAAGPELRQACFSSPEVRTGVRCPTGEARITPGFRLPVAHVIHTVGPIYDLDNYPEVTLRHSYRSCLMLAKDNGIDYVAFPAISCGVFGYPCKEASRVAVSAVKEFSDEFKEVHFVLFTDDTYKAWIDSARELLQG